MKSWKEDSSWKAAKTRANIMRGDSTKTLLQKTSKATWIRPAIGHQMSLQKSGPRFDSDSQTLSD
jgi:hypothetical protein